MQEITIQSQHFNALSYSARILFHLIIDKSVDSAHLSKLNF